MLQLMLTLSLRRVSFMYSVVLLSDEDIKEKPIANEIGSLSCSFSNKLFISFIFSQQIFDAELITFYFPVRNLFIADIVHLRGHVPILSSHSFMWVGLQNMTKYDRRDKGVEEGGG